MKRATLVICGVFVSALVTVTLMAQVPAPKPAVPREPISAILEAFKTHQIVVLGEPHAIEQGHAFRLALIRDPRFSRIVNDIVVECGNVRYQDVMDRFIRGDAIPESSVQPAWRNTVGSPGTTCDLPIYSDFIRAVRAVNAQLPKERQLRVLLGDPPIDWDNVHSIEDALKWAEARDTHIAEVVRREVLAKQRRALMIFGDGHLLRRNPRTNYEREPDDLPGPFAAILERGPGATLFTISSLAAYKDLKTIQADVDSWRVPSLVLLRGTALGAEDFMEYWAAAGGGGTRWVRRDGKRTEIPKDQWRTLRMEDQFDALLYLGPPSSMTRSRLSPALCADSAYMEMRLSRMSLVKQPTDGLKNYCASVTATAK
jgi:hypothetical protein